MMRARRELVVLALVVIAVAACGNRDRSRSRVGSDGGPDSATTTDSGGIVLDGGADGGPGFDAGRDAGPGFDAGRDAGPGFDAGRDAGFDAGFDGGACGHVGIACSASVGCSSGECQPRIDYSVGGSSDPVQGHPSGSSTTEMATYFPNGYCTPSAIQYVDSGGCDPDVETSCGSCGSCLFLGQEAGRDLSMCFLACTPSLTSNPCPQADQQCLLGSNVCLWGCESDDLCAIYRDDTNGNGTIDPYDPTTNPSGDYLVYDTTGNWTCNTTTRRCEHTPPTGADAGSTCTKSSQCELYGRCLDEVRYPDWTGGYCIKSGCDVAGNDCAGGGYCDTRIFGFPVCMAACNVTSTTTGTPLGPSSDCRAGYACMWDGASGATGDNGGCIPGNYNAVTTANTGVACTEDSECYSPYGLGRCLDWDGAGAASGQCTISDCAAPGVPSDICGAGAVCSGVTGSVASFCLETCTTAADCLTGYDCVSGTSLGFTTTSSICFPSP